ncbi:MAG: hypothetical protein ABI707_12945 [Ferruginibacter sp.]
MKKYMLTTAVLIFSFLIINAQTKKNTVSANKFTPIVQVGILEGEAGKTYGQFQLLNGIQRNAWFYGLGLGIDYYASKRSVPLFFDVRRDVIKNKRTPFVYLDGGYNFSWLREDEKIDSWGTDYKARGGLFYETGLGYKFICKNKMAFGLSAGYSFKQQKEMYRTMIYESFTPFPTSGYKQTPEIYDYKFRRISLKFNCSF